MVASGYLGPGGWREHVDAADFESSEEILGLLLESDGHRD